MIKENIKIAKKSVNVVKKKAKKITSKDNSRLKNKKPSTVKKTAKKVPAKKSTVSDKVIHQAKSLESLIETGKLDVNQIDELINYGVDEEAIKYYKEFFQNATTLNKQEELPVVDDEKLETLLQSHAFSGVKDALKDESQDIFREFISNNEKKDGNFEITPVQRILYMLGKVVGIKFALLNDIYNAEPKENLLLDVEIDPNSMSFFRSDKFGQKAFDWKPKKKVFNPKYFSYYSGKRFSSFEEKLLERIISDNIENISFDTLVKEVISIAKYRFSRLKNHKPKDEQRFFDLIFKRDLLKIEDLKEYITLTYTLETDIIKFLFWNDSKLTTPFTAEDAKQFLDKDNSTNVNYQNVQLKPNEIMLYHNDNTLPSDNFVKEFHANVKNGSLKDDWVKEARINNATRKEQDKNLYESLNLENTANLDPSQFLDQIKEKILDRTTTVTPEEVSKKTNWESDKEWFEFWQPAKPETPVVRNIPIPNILDGYSRFIPNFTISNSGFVNPNVIYTNPTPSEGPVEPVKDKVVDKYEEFEIKAVNAYREFLKAQRNFLIAQKDLKEHYKNVLELNIDELKL